MRRVLLIAYYFPPIGGIGSIRLSGFASNLPAFGWEPTVIAPSNTRHARDDSLIFAEENVIRARSLEAASLLPRGRSDAEAATARTTPDTNRASGRAIRDQLLGLAFPDAQIGWYPAALTAALRALRRERFDAIYSSSFPVTAHLVAWSASHHADIPWVAEYRDPWSDRAPFATSLQRRAADRIERAIASTASAVVVPSKTIAAYYAERWGREVEAIPNGYDLPERDRLGVAPVPPPDPPVLAHVGSYYPGRQSLRTVWAALSAMRAAGEKTPSLRWVGALTSEARAELSAAGLLEAVDVTGHVAQVKAVDYLRSSTILVASGQLDASPLGRGTTAAKLFDYLASGLPILYMCNLQSDAAAFLRAQEGCYVVDFEDLDGTIQAIRAGAGRGDI